MEESGSNLERGAAPDLWRNTLAQIPTTFGQLAYLASLRDPNTGEYAHFGLAQIFGPEAAEATLRRSHAQIFGEWLCLNLERQKADLDGYLSGLEGSRRTIVSTWLRLAPFRNFTPANARPMECDLYLADLEALLQMLKNECGAASPDQGP